MTTPESAEIEQHPVQTNGHRRGPGKAPKVVTMRAYALAARATSVPPEIRRNDDGTLDEVVGTGTYHLEQMSATHWWLCFDDYGSARVTVNFHSKATIKAFCEREGALAAPPAPPSDPS